MTGPVKTLLWVRTLPACPTSQCWHAGSAGIQVWGAMEVWGLGAMEVRVPRFGARWKRAYPEVQRPKGCLAIYTKAYDGTPKQVARQPRYDSVPAPYPRSSLLHSAFNRLTHPEYATGTLLAFYRGEQDELSKEMMEEIRMATNAISIQSDASVTTALAGDRMSGFEELYKRFYRRVYSVCLRMTGNVAEAEDLTQEVFIQLHRKLGSFRGEAAFTTWLHRLTVNQVLMHFRKRSVRSELTTEDGELPDSVDPNTINPETMPIVDRIALETAISQLPPGYRTVFVLHDVEGYEHEEIAKILGCSAGTSKSQLHKARFKLRRLLKQRAQAA